MPDAPTSSESPSKTQSSIERPIYVGVDVGGTTIKIGIVDNQGQSLASGHFPTADHLGPQNAVERIRAKIDSLLESLQLSLSDVQAIGLGTPGTHDLGKGVILEPPNLPGWRNFPIRDALAKVCDQLPVYYANDAGAAAYGEYWVGVGREHYSMVMLTLGTGVGGGIIVGDQSIDGEHSHGSECGHVIVDIRPEARRCSCGQRGHLEAYASATAVVRRTNEHLESGHESSLNDRLAQGENLSALMVAQEADSGDELATNIVMETADYLGYAMVSLAHIIDPSLFVLGGAMNFGGNGTPLGRKFLARIKSNVSELAFPRVASAIQIEFATLGGNAGFIGAAGIARSRFQQDAKN